MSSLSLQFHALPIETAALLGSIIEDEEIFLIEMAGSAAEFKIWDRDVSRLVSGDSQIRALALTLKPPTLEAKSMYEFVDRNPGALVCEIGRLTSLGLCESWLTAMGEDEEIMTRWRAVARLFKRNMKSGMIGINPITGASARYKSAYFTSGAQKTHDDGIALLPAAGIVVLHPE